MSTNETITKPKRERKKLQRLVMRDESAHPDHRFVERYADSEFVEDAAILDAWTPRIVLKIRVIETAARR
jgi:hypothetical protein